MTETTCHIKSTTFHVNGHNGEDFGKMYILNESVKANRRAKNSFFNSVNSTMQNFDISAKKKFKILTKLMNNQKYSSMSTLINNGDVVEDGGRLVVLCVVYVQTSKHQKEDACQNLDKANLIIQNSNNEGF